jgi:uncharacterized protein YjbJ (UPF0337 family)
MMRKGSHAKFSHPSNFKLKGEHMDGQMDKIKGRIKQAAGDLTNNKRLKAEGKAEEFRGTVKNKIDQAVDKLKEQE